MAIGPVCLGVQRKPDTIQERLKKKSGEIRVRAHRSRSEQWEVVGRATCELLPTVWQFGM